MMAVKVAYEMCQEIEWEQHAWIFEDKNISVKQR